MSKFPVQQLGPLEQKIMSIIWNQQQSTVQDVLDRLNHSQKKDKLAYTTVMTILNRLHKKKLVSRKKSGKLYLYKPQIDQTTFVRRLVHKITNHMVDKYGETAIAAFVNEANQFASTKKDIKKRN